MPFNVIVLSYNMSYHYFAPDKILFAREGLTEILF